MVRKLTDAMVSIAKQETVVSALLWTMLPLPISCWTTSANSGPPAAETCSLVFELNECGPDLGCNRIFLRNRLVQIEAFFTSLDIAVHRF